MPEETSSPRAGRLDARRLHMAMVLYEGALNAHRDELDSINVYPVPDGDTGTNMLFTQRAVTAALAALPPAGSDDPSAVSDAIGTAALRAARGNSGIILAAVLRALADSLSASANPAAGAALADSLEAADHAAREAVVDPKEGTVLTVLRDAAAGGRVAADAGAAHDAAEVARQALTCATDALAETRRRRPELARAGVVDAGGLGVVLLIDCIRAALVGDEPAIAVGPYGPVGRPAPNGLAPDLGGGAYEVQFIVHAQDESVERLRRELAAAGTSVAISGSKGTYAVHLHTDEPERALAAGTAAGRVEDRAVRPFDVRPDETPGVDGSVRTVTRAGLVAVVEGLGLERLFESLGAAVVVGGPRRTPSVVALRAALAGSGVEGALLLPNGPAILPAARVATNSSEKPASLVEALSIPAGLAAAAAYRPEATLSENAAEMSAAAAAVHAGDVAGPVVETAIDSEPAQPGESFAATIGDTVVTFGDDPTVVAMCLVERLVSDAADAELITIVLGEGASPADTDPVCAAIRNAWPALRIEAIDGGQPYHRYLIGVE